MSKSSTESSFQLLTTQFGRSIYSTKPISVNSKINSYSSKIRVLTSQSLNLGEPSCQNTCQFCLKTFCHEYYSPEVTCITPLVNIKEIHHNVPLRCEFCKIYQYCGYACYLRDWHKFHKYECPIFQNYQKISTSLEIYESIRLIIRMYVCCELDNVTKKKILGLLSHLQWHLNNHAEWIERESIDISNAIILKQNEGNSPKGVPLYKGNDDDNSYLFKYIYELTCIFMINSNEFLNYRNESIGQMIDSDISMINHSCLANSILATTGTEKFVLLSIANINLSKEVFITYCPINFPTKLRRTYLKEKFNFDCSCRLCNQEFDLFFSYNCDKCKQIICEVDLGEFFKDGSQSFKFKEKSHCESDNFITCQTCLKLIEFEKLNEIKKIHRTILSLLILEYTNPIVNDEKFDELEEDLGGIIEQLVDLPLDQLIDLMIPMVSHPLAIGNRFANIFLRLLDEFEKIGGRNHVSWYCFPFNVIIPAIGNFFARPRMEITTNFDIINMISFKLQTSFAIDIPSTLVSSKYPFISIFSNASDILLDSVIYIQRSRDSTNEVFFQGTRWESYQDSKVLEILMKSAYFVAIRAIAICFPLTNIIGLKLLQEVFQYLKRWNAVLQFLQNPDLSRWYRFIRTNLRDSEFIPSLRRLFTMAGLNNMQFKKGKFYLQFADRNYVDIFVLNRAHAEIYM